MKRCQAVLFYVPFYTFLKAVLLLVALLLVGCNEPQHQQATENTTTDSEVAFNLAEVKKLYKDQPLEILDISERTHNQRPAIAITLSVPLNPAQHFQSFFNINKLLANHETTQVDGSWVLSKNGRTLWFDQIEPSQRYRVSIFGGLTAANGGRLFKDHNQELNTRELKPSVSFDTQGAFLPKGHQAGLPLVSVNQADVQIDFFHIHADKLSQFLGRVQYNSHRYWDVENLTRLGKLVYSGRFALDTPKNVTSKRSIPLDNIKPLNQPGIYFAVMLSPGQYHQVQAIWFAVTDIGLHARRYQNQMDIYAASLSKAKPMADVEIQVLDKHSKVLQTLRTDDQGKASFHPSTEARLLSARYQDQVSLLQLKTPALDLSEFDLGSKPQRPMELFIYTPRDLFRPGEVIDFNALLRDQDGHLLPETPRLQVSINRPDGSTAKSFRWVSEKVGYYQQRWQIPQQAPVGNWEMLVQGPMAQPVRFTFKVEQFLPERMELEFNSQASEATPVAARLPLAASDTLKLPVTGRYLYGAPADGNRLSSFIQLSLWRSPIDSLKEFEFGDAQEGPIQQQLELADVYLDDKGNTTLKQASQWQHIKSPLKLNVVASLYESGGRPVTRSYPVLVWPGTTQLGIRPLFNKNEQGEYSPEADTQASFEIINATAAGELAAAEQVDIALIREDRRYFWVYDQSGGDWRWEWSDQEFTEMRQSLSLKQGETGRISLPVAWGRYRLEVRNLQTRQLSSLQFFAGHNWYADWQRAQQAGQMVRPDQITLALDKGAYQTGDTARLKIQPPESGEVLILVEGDQPLWSKRLSVDTQGAEITIPISEDWQQHNIYISALLLQPLQKQQKILTPKRSFGLIHLPLDREQRRLSLDWQLPAKALPNKTLNTKIQVKPAAGTDPQQRVYLTLAAVDVGVLNISEFATPDPFKAFFEQRRYQVDVRDLYHQVIALNQTPSAKIRFGGDSDLSRGGKEPISEVNIVSLFSGLVQTDAQGQAEIPLEIPDFNGRLRLMAVAFSADQFGSAEQEITIAAPVITQLAKPRFLAAGDQSRLALDVRNMQDQASQLEIKLTTTGPIQLPVTASQQIQLQPQQKTTLYFPLQADHSIGNTRINLQVSGDNIESFQRHWQLGNRAAWPAMRAQEHKFLDFEQSYNYQQPLKNVIPETLQARLVVAGQAELDVGEHLQRLLQYPYGCLEQVASRAYPLGFATPERQQQFALPELTDQQRLDYLGAALDKIAGKQLVNGGFGLWDNHSPEEHWLTAYVADFMLNAKEQGILVSEQLLAKTLQRLKEYLNHQGAMIQEHWSEDPAHYTFAYKAYAGYVLSRLNQAPLGSLRNLYDHQFKNAKSGLAMIHMGVALYKMGDIARGRDAIEAGLKWRYDNDSYLGDYGSPLRDMALSVHTLISNKLYVNHAYQLSFQLTDTLARQTWFSTQELNALFLAGISLGSASDQPWHATVTIDDETIQLAQTQSFYRQITDPKKSIKIKSGEEPLFIKMVTQGYPQQAPEPLSTGMSISRHWYNKQGQAVTPTTMKTGELYLVHLQVIAEQQSPDALVVDLLPAGLELENQNLKHAIQLDQFTIDEKPLPTLIENNPLTYQEYRDDRFVAAMNLQEKQPFDLFYLVRAVTPGTYQVPPPQVEAMYRPEWRAIGETMGRLVVE